MSFLILVYFYLAVDSSRHLKPDIDKISMDKFVIEQSKENKSGATSTQESSLQVHQLFYIIFNLS